ncbi:hypothetical protein [Desulfosporosinus lacus]|uniref:Uncharacterized protein n=1 Tax=Desulfosporosinus lacus DSM 15449 TaxID=1121420 RepID=A0A1M5ZM05_9FIRM|nr:hypothetical protein [Desulfosporosinus lacus]SHI25260.1 hypothetical protein SAMN02746098_03397 [Desulfosporosinus lacus DSM 15449]
MFFLKKRVTLDAFIRMIASEVLSVPQHNYENYLTIDPDSILSQREYEEFTKNLYSLRLLLLYAWLIDSKNRGLIKFRLEDLRQTFVQTLQLSYQDNALDQDEALKRSEVFSSELNDFSSYLETIPEKDLVKDGFIAYACLYFTSKFTEPLEKSVKNGMLVSLINSQRMLMKGYLGQAVKKVKII